MDYLGEASLKHFDAVRAVLDAVGQPTASTRAWCAAWTTTTSPSSSGSPTKLGAQGTICGGGRYDGLIELIGGKPAPGSAGAWASSACSTCCSRRAWRRAAPPDAYAVVPDAAALPRRWCASSAARPASACCCTPRQGRPGAA
jgi:histidyl-tRNA synthetase